jgi:hypothetical protein
VLIFAINGGLCINRNNHQKPTFRPLGDFLNPALALLGQGLKKSPSERKSALKDLLNTNTTQRPLLTYVINAINAINLIS